MPEFATAFAASQKEYRSDATAQQWLTTNLSPEVRDGFYKDRQRTIKTLLEQRQVGMIQSVMTDRNGTAYFTDLGPGTYVLSNVIPTELGQTLRDVELRGASQGWRSRDRKAVPRFKPER